MKSVLEVVVNRCLGIQETMHYKVHLTLCLFVCTRYEVVEVEPGKRLVLSGLSEHHTQVCCTATYEQAIFKHCISKTPAVDAQSTADRDPQHGRPVPVQLSQLPLTHVCLRWHRCRSPWLYTHRTHLFVCLVGDICLPCCAICLQMDQFFFMADRHDPNFCCVRYITTVQLREWRAYLQPLATREYTCSTLSMLWQRLYSAAELRECSRLVQRRPQQQAPSAASRQLLCIRMLLRANKLWTCAVSASALAHVDVPRCCCFCCCCRQATWPRCLRRP
jgi:hypothetical protein